MVVPQHCKWGSTSSRTLLSLNALVHLQLRNLTIHCFNSRALSRKNITVSTGGSHAQVCDVRSQILCGRIHRLWKYWRTALWLHFQCAMELIASPWANTYCVGTDLDYVAYAEHYSEIAPIAGHCLDPALQPPALERRLSVYALSLPWRPDSPAGHLCFMTLALG